jgi:hypothetical protein
LLHPVGICAEAKWEISQESNATGLFQKGVQLPAIVRLSTGTADSEYISNSNGRIFGIAVKLFPTRSKEKSVETVNIITLDHYGFDRSKRKRYFHEDAADNSTPVYFTNVAPAKSAFGRLLSTFFDRFDLYPISSPIPKWKARKIWTSAMR